MTRADERDALLEELGFEPFFAEQASALRAKSDLALVPARVCSDAGVLYQLLGCGAASGELSGPTRHALIGRARPTTGDWVLVQLRRDDEPAIIHAVLARKTVLVRRSAGTTGEEQVVAANVDVVWIVTSEGRDLNVRRLERYLTAIRDGGAEPVVILNKIDLSADPDGAAALAESVASGARVVRVSAATGEGIATLEADLVPGRTIGLVGSSGVGKSTLVNRLLADERAFATGATRRDGKGRHTTTRRELRVLPGRGVLIDTPGMRELGLATDVGGREATFGDVAELAARCRFADCRHEAEPGCAVEEAVRAGTLGADRLQSYARLRHEQESAEARRAPALAANSKRRWRTIHREKRASAKEDAKKRR